MSKNWHIVFSILTVASFVAFVVGGIFAAVASMWGITVVCGVLAVFWAFLLRNDYYYFFKGGDKVNQVPPTK